uniref:uncharacterized protein n=1 Tax=Centroberyx gerrardi TaxID=166262 RepID=UPI003AAA4DD2
MMIFIYMIITALAPTALAQGSTVCNLSDGSGTRQCFGALGEPLFFHLTSRANEREIQLIKDNKHLLLKIVNGLATLDQEYINQSEFFINGTFKLDCAMERDSGDYQLETFDSNGVLLRQVNMQLEIQAPVSEPAVSQVCVSPGEKMISCSSEGDGLEFIWTLNNQLLMRTRTPRQFLSNWTLDKQSMARNTTVQVKSSVLTNSIGLHGQLTGNLTCCVQNKVSRSETAIHLTSCKASLSHHFPVVTVAVIASAATLLFLLALCLGITCKKCKKTRSQTVNAGNYEDDVVYADVVAMKNTRKARRPDSTKITSQRNIISP